MGYLPALCSSLPIIRISFIGSLSGIRSVTTLTPSVLLILWWHMGREKRICDRDYVNRCCLHSLNRLVIRYPATAPPHLSPEQCLIRLIYTPVITSTETAEPVTVTEATTTTNTVTSTYHSTVIVTSTAEPPPHPEPSVVTKRAKIQVFRTSNGATVGWMYLSSGPAITSDPSIAGVVSYEILEGATSASQVRFTLETSSSTAPGFTAPRSIGLENY